MDYPGVIDQDNRRMTLKACWRLLEVPLPSQVQSARPGNKMTSKKKPQTPVGPRGLLPRTTSRLCSHILAQPTLATPGLASAGPGVVWP